VPPRGLPARDTTAEARVDSSRFGLGAAESLLGRLLAPGGDAQAALGWLTKELQARGAAFFKVQDDALVVLAAKGDVGDLASHAGLRNAMKAPPDVGEGVQVSDLAGEPPLRCALTTSPDGEILVLCLTGGVAGGHDAERLLRIALMTLLYSRRAVPPAAAHPRSPARPVFPEGYLQGDAPAMTRLYAQMQPLVASDLPVLLLGETGVGKEGLARILHLSSSRSRGPFVAVNCAAIPADLLEAEMFGIGRGIATGVLERKGKFQLAQGGTLFLDEIGDMPMALQVKLLRALQEKEIQPVGGPSLPVDIRVVSATNSDLSRRMDDGLFRRDLYYRLAGFPLQVPPLRERKEDIADLVVMFLERFSAEAERVVAGVTSRALGLLTTYPWPGNIRELEHEMRRLVYQCADGQAIDSTLLGTRIAGAARPEDPGEDPPEDPSSFDLEKNLERHERRYILNALHESEGNRTRAAKLLGISRNGLAIKMDRLGLEATED
jgi:DNA-binding NtrC family response regulator